VANFKFGLFTNKNELELQKTSVIKCKHLLQNHTRNFANNAVREGGGAE